MTANKIADKLISPSGRLPTYSKDDFTNDLMVASSFLVWAEEDRAFYGMESGGDAFRAFCRLLDIDPIPLRKIMLGKDL